MITMDVKGITWVGNMYQQFENMCLEAEDVMYEDTVKYLENQMQAVGTSVKKLYSDIVEDLLPPLSCGLVENVDSEVPVDQGTNVEFCKKPFQALKERPVKANTKQKTRESRTDNDGIHAAWCDGTCEADASFISSSRNSVKRRDFISHSRQNVGSKDIKSNIAIDNNKVHAKMAATKIFNEITLAETDTCKTSQICEMSNENENENHGVSDSKPALGEVTRIASEADSCNEIDNASTEEPPNAPVLVKSAEEKQINSSSSSSFCVPFGEPVGFSMDRLIQSDDCSNSMVVISHPEQGHKTMQPDHPRLEETCVMVTGDELQSVPKGGDTLKSNKKSRRQTFSLYKKSARKQEYKELAVLHGSSEKLKGVSVENFDATSLDDQKKLLPLTVSEPEWELL